MYIAEYSSSSHRIRKVTSSTGLISTFAGTGTGGFSGDGSAATSATLNYPRGVAVDSSANVYIADWLNARIRKVTVSTGIITTIAGGGASGDGSAATSASLNFPQGVALDSSGNVYIADYSNHRVRKVTIATGLISTIAGTGNSGYFGDNAAATSAKVYGPVGVAIDSSGTNKYI